MKVNLKDRAAEALITFFGLGHAPIAPGTFGTLGGLGLAAWGGWTWPEAYGWILPLMVVVLSGIGIALGRWAENRFGKKDPGPFVLDEVAGYLIAAWWPWRRSSSEWYACWRLHSTAGLPVPFPGPRPWS